VDTNGEFLVEDVMPGTYVVTAMDAAMSAPSGGRSRVTTLGQAGVVVEEGKTAEVALGKSRSGRGVVVAGRITRKGRRWAPPNSTCVAHPRATRRRTRWRR